MKTRTLYSLVVSQIDREGRGTDKLSMKRTPKRYINRLPVSIVSFCLSIPI